MLRSARYLLILFANAGFRLDELWGAGVQHVGAVLLVSVFLAIQFTIFYNNSHYFTIF